MLAAWLRVEYHMFTTGPYSSMTALLGYYTDAINQILEGGEKTALEGATFTAIETAISKKEILATELGFFADKPQSAIYFILKRKLENFLGKPIILTDEEWELFFEFGSFETLNTILWNKFVEMTELPESAAKAKFDELGKESLQLLQHIIEFSKTGLSTNLRVAEDVDDEGNIVFNMVRGAYLDFDPGNLDNLVTASGVVIPVQKEWWVQALDMSAVDWMVMQAMSRAINVGSRFVGSAWGRATEAIAARSGRLLQSTNAFLRGIGYAGTFVQYSMQGTGILVGTVASPFVGSGIAESKTNEILTRFFGAQSMDLVRKGLAQYTIGNFIANVLSFYTYEILVEEIAFAFGYGKIGAMFLGRWGHEMGDIMEAVAGGRQSTLFSNMRQVFSPDVGVISYASSLDMESLFAQYVKEGKFKKIDFAPTAEVLEVWKAQVRGKEITLQKLAGATGNWEGYRMTDGEGDRIVAKTGTSLEIDWSARDAVVNDDVYFDTDRGFLKAAELKSGWVSNIDAIVASLRQSGASSIHVEEVPEGVAPRYITYVEGKRIKVLYTEGVKLSEVVYRAANKEPVTIKITRSSNIKDSIAEAITKNLNSENPSVALRQAIESKIPSKSVAEASEALFDLFTVYTDENAIDIITTEISDAIKYGNLADAGLLLQKYGLIDSRYMPVVYSPVLADLMPKIIDNLKAQMEERQKSGIENNKKLAETIEYLENNPGASRAEIRSLMGDSNWNLFVTVAPKNQLGQALITVDSLTDFLGARLVELDQVSMLLERLNTWDSVVFITQLEKLARLNQYGSLRHMEEEGEVEKVQEHNYDSEDTDLTERAEQELILRENELERQVRLGGAEIDEQREALRPFAEGIAALGEKVVDALKRDPLTALEKYPQQVARLAKEAANREQPGKMNLVFIQAGESLLPRSNELGHSEGNTFITKGTESTRRIFPDADLSRGWSGSTVMMKMTLSELMEKAPELAQDYYDNLPPKLRDDLKLSERTGVPLLIGFTEVDVPADLTPQQAAYTVVAKGLIQSAAAAESQKFRERSLVQGLSEILSQEKAEQLAAFVNQRMAEAGVSIDTMGKLVRVNTEEFSFSLNEAEFLTSQERGALVAHLRYLKSISTVVNFAEAIEGKSAAEIRDWLIANFNFVPFEAQEGTLFTVDAAINNYDKTLTDFINAYGKVHNIILKPYITLTEIEEMKAARRAFFEQMRVLLDMTTRASRWEHYPDLKNFKAARQIAERHVDKGVPVKVAFGDFDFLGAFFDSLKGELVDSERPMDDKYNTLIGKILQLRQEFMSRPGNENIVDMTPALIGDELVWFVAGEGVTSQQFITFMNELRVLVSREGNFDFEREHKVTGETYLDENNNPATGLSLTLGFVTERDVAGRLVVSEAKTHQELSDLIEQADAILNFRKLIGSRPGTPEGKNSAGGLAELTLPEIRSAMATLKQYIEFGLEKIQNNDDPKSWFEVRRYLFEFDALYGAIMAAAERSGATPEEIEILKNELKYDGWPDSFINEFGEEDSIERTGDPFVKPPATTRNGRSTRASYFAEGTGIFTMRARLYLLFVEYGLLEELPDSELFEKTEEELSVRPEYTEGPGIDKEVEQKAIKFAVLTGNPYTGDIINNIPSLSELADPERLGRDATFEQREKYEKIISAINRRKEYYKNIKDTEHPNALRAVGDGVSDTVVDMTSDE
ncbi:hypothetical protein KY312_00780, partial [Candidatus Woesearchaeota archaeon]|nr:hypothetical protein [Candidatus Woesearchaeota archaeon]